MKKLLLILSFFVTVSLVNAQELIDDNTLVINDSTTLKVGDEVIVNLPQNFDFTSIEEVKKGFNLKKISKVASLGSAIGGTVGQVGAVTGNIGVMSTGIDIMSTASVATSVGMTTDAIADLNVSDKAKSIISKKLRISKFEKVGSPEIGYGYFAIANVPGDKKKYKIDIEPAIRTNEIIIIKK